MSGEAGTYTREEDGEAREGGVDVTRLLDARLWEPGGETPTRGSTEASGGTR